jgi:TIR domain
MTKVFVNYSTGDEENVAAMLEKYLSDRFDSEVFFRASKSIPYGDDFRRALLEAARTSDALLAVIGTRWLTISENGQRKIDQEDYWTRREIVEAFAHGVRVIPVLIGSADLLTEKDLPPALVELATCQYARLRHRNLEGDLDLLATKLMELVPGLIEKEQPSGGPQVVNNASGNAQVGIQGIVHGNPRFDFGGKS